MMRTFAPLMIVMAIAAPPMVHAQASSGPTTPPLVEALNATMSTAEQNAQRAGFPRRDILAAVSRSMWQTFYHGGYTAAEEAEAVDVLVTKAQSPICKEAAVRMRYELQLN